MHIKISSPLDWQQDMAAVELIKVSSRGLVGDDRRRLVKRAGNDLLARLDRLDVLPGEPLVHLIALSDTETSSANRNGDGFKRACCDRYHPTFVKHARLYYDHKNNDPSKSYGVVKLSAHNRDMGRIELIVGVNRTKEAADRNGGLVDTRFLHALESSNKETGVSMACRVSYDVCFVSGTLIETVDGLQPIEEVQVGTSVKTHLGRLRPVREVMRRAYRGVMTEIEVFGTPEPVRMTEHHPVYLVREGSLRTCHGSTSGRRRRHTVRNGVSACATCDVQISTEREWVDARDVRVGDYVTYPVDRPGYLEIGHPRAYLLGLYTGDGSLISRRAGRKRDGKKRTVGFTVTLDKRHPSVIENVCRLSQVIHGRQQPAYESGNGKNSVQIPVSNREFAELCESWIGSGSRTKSISAEIFSLSEADRLSFLAGVIDSDGCVDPDKGSARICTTSPTLASQIQRLWWGLNVPAAVNKQVCSSYGGEVTAYHVYVSAGGVRLLQERCLKAVACTETVSWTKSNIIIVDGYVHIPVSGTRSYHDDVDVFNFSVEEDESYIAGQFAVHNCSSCGNKAPTRREYCTAATCPHGGCAHNLTKVSEDGHQLHVDNPHPTWFDISHVGHPADRTAFALGIAKQASACTGVVGGAELAERYGLKPDWSNTFGSFGSEDRTRTVLAKLAAAELDLAAQPVGPIDHGHLYAVDRSGCAISAHQFAAKIGADPKLHRQVAAEIKFAFSSLTADGIEAVVKAARVDRYIGTRGTDEATVVKAAAAAAVLTGPETLLSPSRGSVGPVTARLAAEQLAWCAAGFSPDDVDRRVESVVRCNRVG